MLCTKGFHVKSSAKPNLTADHNSMPVLNIRSIWHAASAMFSLFYPHYSQARSNWSILNRSNWDPKQIPITSEGLWHKALKGVSNHYSEKNNHYREWNNHCSEESNRAGEYLTTTVASKWLFIVCITLLRGHYCRFTDTVRWERVLHVEGRANYPFC